MILIILKKVVSILIIAVIEKNTHLVNTRGLISKRNRYTAWSDNSLKLCLHLSSCSLFERSLIFLLLFGPLVLFLLLNSNSFFLCALYRLILFKKMKFAPCLVHFCNVLAEVLPCCWCHNKPSLRAENDESWDALDFKLATQLVISWIVPGQGHPGHRRVVSLPFFLRAVA